MKKYVILILAVSIVGFSYGQKESASKKSCKMSLIPTEQTLYAPSGDTLEFRIEDEYFWVKDKGQYKKLVAWINLPEYPKPLAVARPHVGYGENSWNYVILIYSCQDGIIREAFMDIEAKEVQSVQVP